MLLWVVSSFAADSTIVDSTARLENMNWKEQIAPLTLIAGGLALSAGTLKETIHSHTPRTDTRADDFIQAVPVVELYTANIFLKDHQNSVWDQSKYLLLSEITNGVVVFGLKNTTHEMRPDSSNDKSFPSGHTSQAFVGATVLYHEYKESSPILAYSGYLFATATGVLRMTNNKHWANDVVMGAGIGILATNLIYHFKPLKNWSLPKTKSNVAILPQLFLTDNDGIGCTVAMKF